MLTILVPLFLLYEIHAHPPCDHTKTLDEIEKVNNFIETRRDMFPNLSACNEYGRHTQNGSFNARGVSSHDKFTVCRQQNFEDNKLLIMANISKSDIGKGTPVDNNAKSYLRRYKSACLSDDMGHLVGQEIGGLGLEFNLIPQSRELNVGHFKTVMSRIPRFLEEDFEESRYALVEFALSYPEKNGRPSFIAFIVRLFKGTSKFHATFGMFLNRNYDDTHIYECRDSEQNWFVFTHARNDNFHTRLRCPVDPPPRSDL